MQVGGSLYSVLCVVLPIQAPQRASPSFRPRPLSLLEVEESGNGGYGKGKVTVVCALLLTKEGAGLRAASNGTFTLCT